MNNLNKYLTVAVVIIIALTLYFGFYGENTNQIIDTERSISNDMVENRPILQETHCFNEGIEVDCKG